MISSRRGREGMAEEEEELEVEEADDEQEEDFLVMADARGV
jgi:hypothetical protein